MADQQIKEKSPVNGDDVRYLKIGEIIAIITATLIPITLGSLAILIRNLTITTIVLSIVMAGALLYGLVSCIEGLMKKNELDIKRSRYAIYVAIAAYIVLIIIYLGSYLPPITIQQPVIPPLNTSK